MVFFQTVHPFPINDKAGNAHDMITRLPVTMMDKITDTDRNFGIKGCNMLGDRHHIRVDPACKGYNGNQFHELAGQG